MSNSNSNDGAAGKTHAPGVMCVIVGLQEPFSGLNNGRVVTLEAKLVLGSKRLCACSPKDSWGNFDQLIHGDCWRVTASDLYCDTLGTTPYTTIPQRNLIPIGDATLSLTVQEELLKQRKADLVKKALAVLAAKASLF